MEFRETRVGTEMQLDEFELHDLIVGLRAWKKTKSVDGTEYTEDVHTVKIVPKERDKFDAVLVQKWEAILNDLLERVGKLDGMYHDDAEYTC